MDHQSRVVFIQAMCVNAQAEIASMQAHDRTSDTPYTEAAYAGICAKYGITHNQVIEYLRGN